MSRLSHEAQAIWDAFNEDEAGVFVDYGDKLAAAFRAAAGELAYGHGSGDPIINEHDLLAIADELQAQ